MRLKTCRMTPIERHFRRVMSRVVEHLHSLRGFRDQPIDDSGECSAVAPAARCVSIAAGSQRVRA
jgi:hypothetical protein